jgi:ABC-2 type transport system ATP-binding protein
MQVRLAFSIAIQAKSDILLLDEVLAVGDEAFQKKCIAVFEQYKANKQTIILVTHDMSVVEKFCSRALMIDSGKLVEIGDPSKIARLYSKSNESSYLEAKERTERARKENGVSVQLLNKEGRKANAFMHGETAILNIRWQNDAIKNIGCALLKQSGEYVFGTNTMVDKVKVKGHEISYHVKLQLGAGDYIFKIGVFGAEEKDAIDFLDGPSFLLSQAKEPGWQGLTQLERSWE